jgi:hypothetical protein
LQKNLFFLLFSLSFTLFVPPPPFFRLAEAAVPEAGKSDSASGSFEKETGLEKHEKFSFHFF